MLLNQSWKHQTRLLPMRARPIGPKKSCLSPWGRRLRMEPLEDRTLLSLGSISGTVFEDLDANGVKGRR